MYSDISEAETLHSPVARKSNSTANATYGGAQTLLDPLDDTKHTDLEKSFLSTTNQTLDELRACPLSPTKTPRHKSFIPVSVHSKRNPQLSRVQTMDRLASNSFSEGMLPPRPASHTPLSQSFAGDLPGTPSRGLGEVSMVEWQNRDLFERLARATAKLRDALEECAEVGSHLWTADLTASLSMLNLDRPSECADRVTDHNNAARDVPEVDHDASHVEGGNDASLWSAMWPGATSNMLDRSVEQIDSKVDGRLATLERQNELILNEKRQLEEKYKDLCSQLERINDQLDEQSPDKDKQPNVATILTRLMGIAKMKSQAATTTGDQWDLVLASIRSAGFPVPSGYSPKDCVESLLMDWRLAKDDRESLLENLKHTVPLEQHVQMKQDLQAMQQSLEAYRQQSVGHLDYIRECLDTLSLDVPSDDLIDCIDVLSSEVSKTRECLEQIESENSKLNERLESSVPKMDLQQKQQELDILTRDLEAIKSQLDEDHAVIEQVISRLHPLVPASIISRSATTLVDWICSDYVQRNETLDQLRAEHDDAVKSLAVYVEVDTAGTPLKDLIHLVKQAHAEMQEDSDKLRSEREELLAMFRDFGLEEKDDVLDQVELLLATLVEKQQTLLEFESDYDQLREEFSRAVSQKQYEQTRSELNAARSDLAQAKCQIRDLEASMDRVSQTSLPLDEHRKLLDEVIQKGNQFEEIFQRIRAVLPVDCRETPEDVVATVEQAFKQLEDYKSSIDQLELKLTASSSNCDQWKEKYTSIANELEHIRSHKQEELDEHIRVSNTELQDKIDHLQCELSQQQATIKQLESNLKSRECELDLLSTKLHEAQLDMNTLNLTIQAKTESVEAAISAALAHEERANQLASHLDALRQEHAQCSVRAGTQTSPANKSRSAEQLVCESDDLRKEHLASRARKYGELKAVAFEIKEKLIHRTNKLEAALTEVARLRSIIQQDKQHASRVLEEVEDLRKQAIRKNRRIHELESELARLKSSAPVHLGDSRPVSSARNTRSSARTVSEVEHPRGNQYHTDPAFNESLRAASIEPTIHSIEFERRSHSSSLPSDSLCPQYTPEREMTSTLAECNVKLSEVVPTTCNHCDELQTLVTSLQNLSMELQRRVDLDLTEEQSLLATLERHPVAKEQDAASTRSHSVCDMLQESTLPEHSTRSIGCSMNDLRFNIRSLQHARSRLKHYAEQMDKVCANVVERLQGTTGESHSGDLRPLVNRSVTSLCALYRNLKSLLAEIEDPHRSRLKRLARDVKGIIRQLSGHQANDSPSSGGEKENQTPDQRELVKRAGRYCRRYEKLARGLDLMTEELSETTNVLSAARSSLERTAGLSGFSPNSSK